MTATDLIGDQLAAREGMCPICGAGPWRSLAIHASKRHGINRDELKARLGIPNLARTPEPPLVAAGRAHQAAKADEVRARDALYVAIRTAIADGMSESEAARRAGVDRMTVRGILGKR